MDRASVDHDAIRGAVRGRCFICELLAGNPEFAHEVVFEDDDTICFLNKYPTLLGYVLIAPKHHLEQVTGDFSEEEYLRLQRVIYRVGEAVRAAVPTERLYVLSLGSQQANRHVHWHIAPLPPGVPFDQQQYRAVDRTDMLRLDDGERAALAASLRGHLEPG
jgi:diadenosine tetraphosphate (Ap4A) HIT family hydrolase